MSFETVFLTQFLEPSYSPAATSSAPTPAYNPGLAPPPPRPSSPQARAMYPFTAGNPQELSFQPGDILSIMNQEGAWWQAELHGNVGLIPSNYVELI
jgi:hypothetical protein